MTRAPSLVVAIALALAGCGQGEKQSGGKVEGEVLPGSASDAMLRYDEVRSQAPLAPAGTSSSGKAGVRDGTISANAPRAKASASAEPSDNAAPSSPSESPAAASPKE